MKAQNNVNINPSMTLKSKKKRKLSSTLWLQRQEKDPYVLSARKQGYRSRAAYKLKELDEQFHFLKPGIKLLDLGAAPGGWLQIALERIKPQQSGGKVVGVDLLEIEPLEGAEIIQGDFYSEEILKEIQSRLDGQANVILSDMAPSTIGHQATDHLRIIALCEAAWDFAKNILSKGGTFIIKVFQGGMQEQLLKELKSYFPRIKHVKPKASRKESSEIYLVAIGFKGFV